MWNQLRTDVADRFTAVETYFVATHRLGGEIARVARGLVFVQLYAAHENTVRAVVRIGLDAIMVHRHSTQDLAPSLMALFLNPELQSVRNCSEGDLWKQRIKLFERVYRKAPAGVANTTFPKDDSHYRTEQLQTIFDIFGIKRSPLPRRRHQARLKEMVDNRNAIAHGRETPEAVGQRFTRADIIHRIKQIKGVCSLLIKTMEAQCSNPDKHCRVS